MKTEKYEKREIRFLLTWLVLSDSRFSEEAIFSAKPSRSIIASPFQALYSSTIGMRENAAKRIIIQMACYCGSPTSR